jgi:hypothetical protein
MSRIAALSALSLLLMHTMAHAQKDLPPGPRAAFGHPVVLALDDRPAFSDPPAGFATRRKDVPHGRQEMVEYDSKTAGSWPKARRHSVPSLDHQLRMPSHRIPTPWATAQSYTPS